MTRHRNSIRRAGRRCIYSKTVHEECERGENFEEGRFVRQWGDAKAQRGWRLVKMSCRGPVISNRILEMKWDGGASWPVDSGRPHIGHDERELAHAGER